MRRLALWIVFNIPIGRLAPHLFGFAVGASSWKRADNKREKQLTKKSLDLNQKQQYSIHNVEH